MLLVTSFEQVQKYYPYRSDSQSLLRGPLRDKLKWSANPYKKLIFCALRSTKIFQVVSAPEKVWEPLPNVLII